MFLVRRKSDNLVQYFFSQRPRIKKFLKYPIVALDITNDTHEIIEADIPSGVVPGAYSFDKTWTNVNPDIVPPSKEAKLTPKEKAVQELEKIKSEHGEKQLSMSYIDKRLSALEKILVTL